MGLPADHPCDELGGGRHRGTRRVRHPAQFHIPSTFRRIAVGVKRQDQVGTGVGQRTLGDHQLRAAGLARGQALFRRLEDEHHRPGELRLHPGEQVGDAELGSDVRIVTTGVGNADLAAEIGGGADRLEWPLGLLGDRERIHVGADRHDGAWLPAAQDADDAGVCDTGAHHEAQPGELAGDDRGGPGLVIAQLRVLVDVVPYLDHPRRQSGDGVAHVGVGLGDERWGQQHR